MQVPLIATHYHNEGVVLSLLLKVSEMAYCSKTLVLFDFFSGAPRARVGGAP